MSEASSPWSSSRAVAKIFLSETFFADKKHSKKNSFSLSSQPRVFFATHISRSLSNSLRAKTSFAVLSPAQGALGEEAGARAGEPAVDPPKE